METYILQRSPRLGASYHVLPRRRQLRAQHIHRSDALKGRIVWTPCTLLNCQYDSRGSNAKNMSYLELCSFKSSSLRTLLPGNLDLATSFDPQEKIVYS